MKYTVNIPQDIGQHPNASRFLSDTLRSLLVLLEQRGLPLVPLAEREVTPELLERLLFQRVEARPEPAKFSKNKALNGFLTAVERTGGIKKESAEVIRRLGREFREDFELRHDKKL
ncbi:hypothetical protein THIOM_003022 [Candidatus Thiomargarita nelsonii]|uniref:Uncharacterized protein n=1 Tax=Candidatus Thiomargarita nelsonii TaxID=1003181 RepID=A0A0A6NZQ3_9GAMM|nr:hypothetical protein THIOM_003022 [Candidatus Thiomargarita nelsonii]